MGAAWVAGTRDTETARAAGTGTAEIALRRREPPIEMEHGYATGMGPHPDEVKIIAPAGSVIFFNSSDLWHSGTFNYTPAARLALTVHIGPGPPPARDTAVPATAPAKANGS